VEKAKALGVVEVNPNLFRADFREWLNENWHVWLEFRRRAMTLVDYSVKRYGARTIWETMRWDSTIGELSGKWKLNNNAAPDLGRLFNLENPDYNIFETRVLQANSRQQLRSA
jgi:hypothetical protein